MSESAVGRRSFCLVFHLNQDVVPYSSVAAAASYRPLLKFLRADERRRVTLHISGTLLLALNWLEQDLVDGFAELARNGQVELLGSTFAQAIPYASEPEDSDLQSRLHRRFVERCLCARPVGFWNPERCWYHDYPALLARHGYSYTLVEDHLLEAAGLGPDDSVAELRGTEGLVRLVRDDQEVRHLVNAEVWGSYEGELHRLLGRTRRSMLVWAEDAEAIGLWALEHGQSPTLHWARFTALCREIQERGDVVFRTLSEALAQTPSRSIPCPPWGQASWMVDAIGTPGARFHEPGFIDWFDYVHRSPKVREESKLVSEARDAVGTILSSGSDRPIEVQAQVSLAAAQFERGCVGVLQLGAGPAARLQATWVLGMLSRLLEEEPTTSLRQFPPGSPLEGLVAWATPEDLLVFSAAGELLYWIDRETGHELCGNENAASFFGDRRIAPVVEEPQRMIDELAAGDSPFAHGGLETNLPDGLRQAFRPAERRRVVRDAPRASHARVHVFERTLRTLPEREGALLEQVSCELVDEGGAPRWSLSFGSIRVERRMSSEREGLRVVDVVTASQPCPSSALRYTVRHALCPGYVELLESGQRGLIHLRDESRAGGSKAPCNGVYNERVGIGVQLRAYGAATCSSPGMGLLDVPLDLTWEFQAERKAQEWVASYVLAKLRSSTP